MAITSPVLQDSRSTLSTSVLRTLKNGWGIALVLLVVLRLGLSLVALTVERFSPMPVPCENGKAAPVLQRDNPALGAWQRWDVCWFETIAIDGYRSDPGSVGFLPFYPLLLRTVAPLFMGNLTLTGLLISAIAFVIAMSGFYQLVCLDFDRATAKRSVLYLALFPSAFYLLIPYAESVLLALIVWSFLFARKSMWGKAAIVATLAGITRSPGVLLCLPLAWEVWSYWRKNRKFTFAWCVPILPLVSFAIFNEYCKAVAGWSYFQGTQATWGGQLVAPWIGLERSWQFVRSTSHAVEALNLGLLALSAVVILAGLRSLRFSYSLFAIAQWVLISGRLQVLTPLMGSARYLLMLFPLFMMLALYTRRQSMHWIWLVLSGSLLCTLLVLFLIGAFVA